MNCTRSSPAMTLLGADSVESGLCPGTESSESAGPAASELSGCHGREFPEESMPTGDASVVSMSGSSSAAAGRAGDNVATRAVVTRSALAIEVIEFRKFFTLINLTSEYEQRFRVLTLSVDECEVKKVFRGGSGLCGAAVSGGPSNRTR